MNTETLTVCGGKVGSSGYCEKCGKKSLTSSNICGNLVPFYPILQKTQCDMIEWIGEHYVKVCGGWIDRCSNQVTRLTTEQVVREYHSIYGACL